MTDESRSAQRTAAQRRRRRRIATAAAVALTLGVITVAVLTAYVANRALVAKDALQSAQSHLIGFRAALAGDGDADTRTLATRLHADTAKAARQVDDPVWALYEKIPALGPNLVAFRHTAELLDDLVVTGVQPLGNAADGLSLATLKPRDGRIDIAPLRRIVPALDRLDAAIALADRRAGAIDTSHVLGQLRDPVVRLRGLLKEAAPVTHELRQVAPVLYPALGGEGPRHYLLMFQNNAEERASGGNPAALAMLDVEDGTITLGRQPNSGSFPEPYAEPPLTPDGPGNEEWDRIYTDYASAYLTNITMTPDFPSTAQMARAMWRKQFGGRVDGVISFDPIALSYLLKATGPLKLADGHRISSADAVSYLLHDVYAKYPDPRVQDAVFASAARAVFAALTDGKGDPKTYLAQVGPMIAEQRLKVWSIRPDEEALLMRAKVANMLPADNSEATVLGVYNNDDSTSKMSYFMDERISVTTNTCEAAPQYTVSATVINTLPVSRASSLPDYVRAHQAGIVPGGDRQWVQVYGPVGAKLKAVTIDGEKVVWGTNFGARANTNRAATGQADGRPAVKGTMYDRPVGLVNLNMGPASSMTVKAVFEGGTGDSRTVEVSHTPKVRPVPVRITAARCG